MPIYNGGLLMVSLRYFDADRSRPGLPQDVAALVSSITEKGIILTFVNTHPMDSRTVVLQSGAFAEHRFTTASWSDDLDMPVSSEVNSAWLEVVLGPGTVLDLQLGLDRFCRQPSYELPL
jgi:hypothetical protein